MLSTCRILPISICLTMWIAHNAIHVQKSANPRQRHDHEKRHHGQHPRKVHKFVSSGNRFPASVRRGRRRGRGRLVAALHQHTEHTSECLRQSAIGPRPAQTQTPGIQSGIMSGRSGMMLPGDKGPEGGGAGVGCGVSVPLVGACQAHERGGERVSARAAFCAVTTMRRSVPASVCRALVPESVMRCSRRTRPATKTHAARG